MDNDFVKDVEQEAKSAMKKKMYITVFVMLIILAIAFFVERQTDGYPMNIKTGDDMVWGVEISDPGVLTIVSDEYSGGKYRMVLEGVSEGKTEIHMVRTAKNDGTTVLEERTYHMKVDENNKVIQESVDRTVY